MMSNIGFSKKKITLKKIIIKPVSVWFPLLIHRELHVFQEHSVHVCVGRFLLLLHAAGRSARTQPP